MDKNVASNRPRPTTEQYEEAAYHCWHMGTVAAASASRYEELQLLGAGIPGLPVLRPFEASGGTIK